MRLLIPIPRVSLDELRACLGRVAPFDWATRGKIHVFPVEGAARVQIADRICEYCESNNIRHVLVPRRLHCDERTLTSAGYSVISGPLIAELLRGGGLY